MVCREGDEERGRKCYFMMSIALSAYGGISKRRFLTGAR